MDCQPSEVTRPGGTSTYFVIYTVTVDAEDEEDAIARADAGKGGGHWQARRLSYGGRQLQAHEHEAWQIRESASGAPYCAACGGTLTADARHRCR